MLLKNLFFVVADVDFVVLNLDNSGKKTYSKNFVIFKVIKKCDVSIISMDIIICFAAFEKMKHI